MKYKNYYKIILLILLAACTGQDYVPKPKGYNLIDLPLHNYTELKEDHPYTFEYSTEAKILKDSSALAEPHWIDIYYPQYKANVQITYKNFTKKTDYKEYVNDAHKLASKHQVKAYSIDEGVIKTKKGYTATVFELQGEVPSQFQFYVTDSTKNFLRGALYFRTATKNDSLAPIIEYIKLDVMHLLNTLEWKNK